MFSEFSFITCVILIYIFFPCIPKNKKNVYFGIINFICLYTLFGVDLLFFIIISSVVFWILMFFLKKKCENKNFIRFSLPVLGLFIFTMVFFSDLRVLILDALHRERFEAIDLFAVIGASYIGLRMWDCAAAVFAGERLINPIALSGYFLPFFMVFAGPISSYRDHLSNDAETSATFDLKHFADSCVLLSLGYALKFFCAEIYIKAMLGMETTWPVTTPWETWQYLVYVLLEFWGYSLIALGVGRLIGIHTPQNFDNPLISRSVGEFWTRWHISLGAFAARTLYNPVLLFLLRKIPKKNKSLLFLSNLAALWGAFVFIGLWHDLTLGYALWGICVGLIVAIEKSLLQINTVTEKVVKLSTTKWKYIFWPFGILYTQILISTTLTLAVGNFL